MLFITPCQLTSFLHTGLSASLRVGRGPVGRCWTGQDEKLRWDTSADENQVASGKHFHPACQGHQDTHTQGTGCTSGK